VQQRTKSVEVPQVHQFCVLVDKQSKPPQDAAQINQQLTAVLAAHLRNDPNIEPWFEIDAKLLGKLAGLFNKIEKFGESDVQFVLGQKILTIIFLNLKKLDQIGTG